MGIKFWVGANRNNIKVSDTKRFDEHEDDWYLYEDIFKRSKKGQYLYEYRPYRGMAAIRKINRSISDSAKIKNKYIFSNRKKLNMKRLRRYVEQVATISYYAYNIYYN